MIHVAVTPVYRFRLCSLKSAGCCTSDLLSRCVCIPLWFHVFNWFNQKEPGIYLVTGRQPRFVAAFLSLLALCSRAASWNTVCAPLWLDKRGRWGSFLDRRAPCNFLQRGLKHIVRRLPTCWVPSVKVLYCHAVRVMQLGLKCWAF